MTKQESFKRRVRDRMSTTGERYVEARRVLLAQVSPAAQEWVSQPEMSDDAIRAGTGKGWEEWRTVIDEWPGHVQGHTAIAAFLREECGVEPWWCQGVTVGYERITGLRLPHQMADGTFTANKSRTIKADAELLRELLLDDEARQDLFPNEVVELRSNPTAKALRFAVGGGTATVGIDALADGRVKVTVGHAKLAEFDDVERWKFYWSDWLDAIDEQPAT